MRFPTAPTYAKSHTHPLPLVLIPGATPAEARQPAVVTLGGSHVDHRRRVPRARDPRRGHLRPCPHHRAALRRLPAL